MIKLVTCAALTGILTMGVLAPANAASPVKSFAPGSCRNTVFAQTTGTQYGFTSCTSHHRISLIVGDGRSWRTVRLGIHGIPLAAADSGKMTYVVYSAAPGSVSIAWVGHGGHHASAYLIQDDLDNVMAGGVIATTSHWRADWSESRYGDIWSHSNTTGPVVSRRDLTTSMSMRLIRNRPALAWVTRGVLRFGTSGTDATGAWTSSRVVTRDRVGAPRLLVINGNPAVAYPDYTTNTARLAVWRNGTWSVRTLGSIGSADNSIVSAGSTSKGAVIAWQNTTGLRVTRYLGGTWHTNVLSGAASRALATSGVATLTADGRALLLGRTTSRLVG